MGSKLDGHGNGVGQGDKELCVGHVKFEMSIRQQAGNVKQVVGYILLELKGEVSTRAINPGGKEFEEGVLSIQLLFKVNGLDDITQEVRQGQVKILGLNLGPYNIQTWSTGEILSKRRIPQ